MDQVTSQYVSHDVSIDDDSEFASAFCDLGLVLQAIPTRTERRKELERLGDWIGQQLFGNIGVRLRELARTSRTVTVSIRAITNNSLLLSRPIELARVDGEFLLHCGIRFEYSTTRMVTPRIPPQDSPVRILSIYSLPDAHTPLDLRRERHELRNLYRELRGVQRRDVTLRVLQWGTTRESLYTALTGAEWDAIHFSGHGSRGGLMLEKPDGRPDFMTTDELVALFRDASPSVRLMTIAACNSGASDVRLRESLGLLSRERDVGLSDDQRQVDPSLVMRLSEALGCISVGMRYPVDDRFAIQFVLNLYRRLLESEYSVPAAVNQSLKDCLQGPQRPGVDMLAFEHYPVHSPIVPIVCGIDSQLVTLVAKPSNNVLPVREVIVSDETRPSGNVSEAGQEPRHFVGRVSEMREAASADYSQRGK